MAFDLNDPNSKMKLIREFFHPVSMLEMKDLTSADRDQLASGIARSKGLSQDQLKWELVAY